MSAERKPSGRPKLPDGIRKSVTLDAQTVAAAELLGGGNLSRGIRRAFIRPAASADAHPSVPAEAPAEGAVQI